LIILVGQPNSGKSSVLSRLTGAKVVVSNYPGTSLDLMRGKFTAGNRSLTLADTPGIYSLSRPTAEEVLTRDVLESPEAEFIINVVDAADLSRGLALTLELMALGKPMLILLNQVDRLRSGGNDINYQHLSRLLKVPVLPFSALTGEGLMEIFKFFERGDDRGIIPPNLDMVPEIMGVDSACSGNCSQCTAHSSAHSEEEGVIARHQQARQLAAQVTVTGTPGQLRWLERVQRMVDHAFLGPVILMGLAYIAFKVLVGFAVLAESNVSSWFAPVQTGLENLIITVLPHGFFSHVVSKSLPEGLLIPFTLVMPAMLMISLIMSLLEDTGLLPRYAVALERIGSLFGVSGQAIIPLSLGFGCRTPAVVATRMLPSREERFIVITLLSIVIPCAATIGILTSVIAAFGARFMVLVFTMAAIFVLLGLVLKKRY